MSEEKTQEELHAVAVEKASAMHWVPKEDYTGDPTKWRDAEEFLEFGERVLPIVQENNKRLIADNTALKKEIEDIRIAVTKFAKVHEETEKAAYAHALESLKAERKAAFSDGDYDRAEEITEQMDATKEAAAQATAKAVAEAAQKSQQGQAAADSAFIADTFAEWSKDNQWAVEGSPSYDIDMEAYAKGIGDAMAKKQGVKTTGADFRPFLDKVAQKVKERFPEKFGNPLRKGAGNVESDGGSGDAVATSKKTYANLPKEAKESCTFLIETGTFKSREEYVARYKW